MNPYQSILDSLNSQKADIEKRIQVLNTKRNTSGWFSNITDSLEYDKLNSRNTVIARQIGDATKNYNTYNSDIVKSQASQLSPDYATIYEGIAMPQVQATDRYIDTASSINANLGNQGNQILDQQIARANELAQQQRRGVLNQEANQAGLISWLSTQAWLNPWQMAAGQQLVNADTAQQLASVSQAQQQNIAQAETAKINLANQIAQTQQQLEAQRANAMSGLSQTFGNLALQDLQVRLAKAAQTSSGTSWWSMFNPNSATTNRTTQTEVARKKAIEELERNQVQQAIRSWAVNIPFVQWQSSNNNVVVESAQRTLRELSNPFRA